MTPEQILKECSDLMKRKRADYSDASTHQNFERSESVVAWYENNIDKVYVTLITTKLARLAVLLNSKAEPKNESIRDSFKDLVNYSALWSSKRG